MTPHGLLRAGVRAWRGAERDEPVTEQAGGLPLVVGGLAIVLVLPGGLVAAVGQLGRVLVFLQRAPAT